MKKIAVLLIASSLMVSLVGCSNNKKSTMETNIYEMENIKVTQEYKDTVRSIGNKLFVDNELEIDEKVKVVESVKVDVAYYIQEQKSLAENDKNVADHDEDLDTGDSKANADMEIDYSILGIPSTPVDEVEENLELIEERMKVRIIEESYYSNTTILKYGNDDGSIFKILEIEGNSVDGVKKIVIKER